MRNKLMTLPAGENREIVRVFLINRYMCSVFLMMQLY